MEVKAYASFDLCKFRQSFSQNLQEFHCPSHNWCITIPNLRVSCSPTRLFDWTWKIKLEIELILVLTQPTFHIMIAILHILKFMYKGMILVVPIASVERQFHRKENPSNAFDGFSFRRFLLSMNFAFDGFFLIFSGKSFSHWEKSLRWFGWENNRRIWKKNNQIEWMKLVYWK